MKPYSRFFCLWFQMAISEKKTILPKKRKANILSVHLYLSKCRWSSNFLVYKTRSVQKALNGGAGQLCTLLSKLLVYPYSRDPALD